LAGTGECPSKNRQPSGSLPGIEEINVVTHQGKVFSKQRTDTPIASVHASVFENGRFWHASFTVSSEELAEFGPGFGNLPEFLLQLEDGRTGAFIENRREIRIGEQGIRLHVMGIRALDG
jgi:hypothetical protein